MTAIMTCCPASVADPSLAHVIRGLRGCGQAILEHIGLCRLSSLEAT